MKIYANTGKGLFGFALTILLTFSTYSQDAGAKDKFINAVYSGNLADVSSTLNEGVDVNMLIYGQATALQIAASRGDIKMVNLLISKQADVNRKKSGGWTALMGAADNGHLPVIKILIQKKADISATTSSGRTVLMRAAYHGQTTVVKYLLSKGANINATDSQGVTALMLAAQQGFAETVRVLLAAKADKELKSVAQKTALIYAQERTLTSYTSGSKSYFDETIKLLSQKLSSTMEKFIGKIHKIQGNSIVITGKQISLAKPGNKLQVKTSSGIVTIVAKQGMHTQLKAVGAKSQIAKIKVGDSVYLNK